MTVENIKACTTFHVIDNVLFCYDYLTVEWEVLKFEVIGSLKCVISQRGGNPIYK